MANPGPFNPGGPPGGPGGHGGPMGPGGPHPGMGSGPNPNMMGGPMGAQQMPRPATVRRGTSKAVPVVVSAGLAVGVFCGLLFGLGTGKDEAIASTTPASNGVKAETDGSHGEGAKPDQKGSATGAVAKSSGSGSGSSTAAASSGSGAGSASSGSGSGSAVAASGSGGGSGSASSGNGSGSGSAVASANTGSGAGSGSAGTTSTSTTVKLTLDVKPDPGAGAKITLDGKAIDISKPLEVDIGADKLKTVKIAVTANGFHYYEDKVVLKGDTTVHVELQKRPVVGNTSVGIGTGRPTGTTNSGNSGKKGDKGGKKGGGVIDLP